MLRKDDNIVFQLEESVVLLLLLRRRNVRASPATKAYRAFEQDLRAHIDGLNHYATMTFGIVQTQETDIREIKSILNEHSLALAQMQEDFKGIKSTQSEHTSILNKHGEMLERILSLLEPKS